MLVAAGLGPAPEHALTAGGSWQHCAPASKRSPGIPEHPREGRPARQRAETRQARLRPPARITEPPPRTPPRRRQDNQEGTHPQGQARTHRLNGKLRPAHCCASVGWTSDAQTRPRLPEFGFPGSRSRPANHS
jgi:hypothetical protein